MAEKETLVKERALLDKQRELLWRQASEVRDECKKIHDQYQNREPRRHEREGRARGYTIDQFIDIGSSDGYATLLLDAITYYETRDGCPFFDEKCRSVGNLACNGIWVKMGAPCPVFTGSIKQAIKEAAVTSK